MSKVPGGLELLARGLVAGLVSGGFNLLYFFVYLAATDLVVRQPTWGSVSVSSLVPCLLAALGYAWLARRSERADTYYAVIVGAVVVASFAGMLRATLPDGSVKPAGFDGLVMPMHVVVGLAAVILIPPSVAARLMRRTSLCFPA